MVTFQLDSCFSPPATSRKPSAMVEGLEAGCTRPCWGVTGSGKISIANVIAPGAAPDPGPWRRTRSWRPSSTGSSDVLPAQFRGTFVSSYDYYRPGLRTVFRYLYRRIHVFISSRCACRRPKALLEERPDAIIVATVCRPSTASVIPRPTRNGPAPGPAHIDQRELLRRLTSLQYTPGNDMDFARANFPCAVAMIDFFGRIRSKAIRVELFDDEVESLLGLRSAHRRGDRVSLLRFTFLPPRATT